MTQPEVNALGEFLEKTLFRNPYSSSFVNGIFIILKQVPTVESQGGKYGSKELYIHINIYIYIYIYSSRVIYLHRVIYIYKKNAVYIHQDPLPSSCHPCSMAALLGGVCEVIGERLKTSLSTTAALSYAILW